MPTRTCIVCRSKYEKKLLNRIVVDERGEVLADLDQKAQARGAYICGDCLSKTLDGLESIEGLAKSSKGSSQRCDMSAKQIRKTAGAISRTFKRGIAPDGLGALKDFIKE